MDARRGKFRNCLILMEIRGKSAIRAQEARLL